MVRIPGFDCHGLGSVPGQGTEILRATRCSQNIHTLKKNFLTPLLQLTSLTRTRAYKNTGNSTDLGQA